MSAEERCCPGHGSMAHVRGCVHHPEHRPATPDAGDAREVEALAKAMRDAGIERGYVGADAIRYHWAERLLASDWLAAREAAARAEGLMQVLDPDGEGLDMARARLLDAAARMDNPFHRGNQHRWPEHARMFRDLASFIARGDS